MKRVAAEWTDIVLVCRKCAKKLKGGFGPDGDDNLIKALRAEAARDGGRAGKPKRRGTRIAVLEADCLDICPKNAAIVINARKPDVWRIVPSGADTAQVLSQLEIKT